MKLRLTKETQKHVEAFTKHFGSVRIEKIQYDKGFYVYYPENADNYLIYCPDNNYLQGWLYGAIQCKNMFPVYERIYNKKEGV